MAKRPRDRQAAMAIVAHPDDIEFLMAGTLLLLREAGYDTHYMTVANGSCGSQTLGPAAIRRTRRAEARAAARILGATFHEALVDDLQILYEYRLLRRLAAVVRAVAPRIVLVPSPQDYMEDHVNTCRLAVSAVFARSAPNFRTLPSCRATHQEATVYHAMPHGLRDPLRRRIVPGFFVNTERVQETKRRALAAHRSQQDYLRSTQRFPTTVEVMDAMAREVGQMSGRFEYAEGWRRHSHIGFCGEHADPLGDALGADGLVNASYETELG
jgi:LmbE family N-acetylglucosaminyl deacetylase